MFDPWDNLEGVTHHAVCLCYALDQWKHWANGRNLDDTALAEIAATFGDHDDRPTSISSPHRSLSGRSDEDSNSNRRPHPAPSRPSMGIEIDF